MAQKCVPQFRLGGQAQETIGAKGRSPDVTRRISGEWYRVGTTGHGGDVGVPVVLMWDVNWDDLKLNFE